MPIYVYQCESCGCILDIVKSVGERGMQFCPDCGLPMRRAHEREVPAVVPDMPEHYNESLGEVIKSRSHFRERLAHHNAGADLMIGGHPSAGRLTKEERAEAEGRSIPGEAKTIFERRRQPGWASNPPRSRDGMPTGIEVDGTPDYDYNKLAIRRQHGWTDDGRPRRK